MLDLAAPPGATQLVSGLGDIGGFVHTDITKAPSAYSATAPFMGSVNGTDFAEKTPATMVRVGSGDAGSSHISVSTSGGSSWWAGQEPGGVTGGGNVAMSADGSRIVWSADGAGVHTSSTLGSSWTRSTGPATGARVESDRVNPLKFYAFSGGTFWTSTDGGVTFTASAATGLPTAGNVRFAAVPGREGDVWLTGGDDDGHLRDVALDQLGRDVHQDRRGRPGRRHRVRQGRSRGRPTRRSTRRPRSAGSAGSSARSTPAPPGSGSTTTSTSGAGRARWSSVTPTSTGGSTWAPTAAASSSAT